jgi:DNA-directed RNA polymerase specialized sigma24 family protein
VNFEDSQPDTEPLPDDALLEAYRQGNEGAAEVLFQRYYVRLVNLTRSQMGGMLCRLEDSADVAQSVFQSVFLRGRAHQIELGPDDNLWPLLVTITVNKIRNRVKYWTRQRRDQRRQVPLDARDPLETGPTPEDAVRLQELISELREPFSDRRRPVIDGLLAGHSVADIAAQTGMAERTVYKTRQALKDMLDRMVAEE